MRDSFTAEKDFEELLGGVETARLLRAVANRIAAIEVEIGIREHHTWLDDPFAFAEIRAMLNGILDRIKPSGRRVMPEWMRHRHPVLKKNIGRRHALEALALMEAEAKYPFGSRLRGSPIAELRTGWEQARERILENRMKRNTAAERKTALKFEKLQAPLVSTIDPIVDSAVNHLVLYLKPKVKPGLPKGKELTMVDVLRAFEGVTGANMAERKPAIIERLKRVVRGKLTDESGLDANLGRLVDAAVNTKRIQNGERR